MLTGSQLTPEAAPPHPHSPLTSQVPVLLEGGVPEAPRGFSWADVDRILSFTSLGPRQLTVTGAPQQVDALVCSTAPATGTIHTPNLSAIKWALRAGGTLSLNSVDDLHPWVRTRAEMFEDELLVAVNVNCHVSFHGKSGLGVHTDPHDVHAIQTTGSKHWRILGNAEVPSDRATHEFVTVPGDLLFLPRGWWHAVQTVEPSIHLTVGVSWPTPSRLAALRGISVPPTVDWDVPLHPSLDPGVRAQASEALASLLGDPAEGLIEDLMGELRARTPFRRTCDLAGEARRSPAGKATGGGVVLRRPRWTQVVTSGGVLDLQGGARSVRMSLQVAPVVQAWLEGAVMDAAQARSIIGEQVSVEQVASVLDAVADSGIGVRA